MTDKTNAIALITKTQSLIAAGDITGAEAALVELADAEGDQHRAALAHAILPHPLVTRVQDHVGILVL